MKLFLLTYLALFCSISLSGQSHSLFFSSGYAGKGYLQSTGIGYNITVGYSYKLNSKWRFRIQVAHSNTYNQKYDVGFSRNDNLAAATIMRYAEFPADGTGRELHPFFVSTNFYEDYPSSFHEFDGSPEYGHDRGLFFILDYPILEIPKLSVRLGGGSGLSLSNRQERVLFFTVAIPDPIFQEPVFNEKFQIVRYFYWGGYLDAQIQYELKENTHLFARAAYFCELPRVFDVGARKAGTLNVNVGLEFSF